MRLIQFLLHYHFNMSRPNEIHPWRWNAMVKWIETRKKLTEPEVFPDY